MRARSREMSEPTFPIQKSLADVRQELLESLPKTPEMAEVRSHMVTLIKGMVTLVGGKVYGCELQKIERVTHYRLILELVDQSFLLTEDKIQNLRLLLKGLHKWEIIFTQRKEEATNFFIVELHKIQSFKIL